MNLTETMLLDASPTNIYPLVSELNNYPAWLGFLHRADTVDGPCAVPPVWAVELRARVGPLTRSKQLRMIRTVDNPPHQVRFERCELDDREHADWVLAVTLKACDEQAGPDQPQRTEVTIQLHYSGRLWTGGLLDRVLHDDIQNGREYLARSLSEQS